MADRGRFGGARVVVAPDGATWAGRAAAEVIHFLAEALEQWATVTLCLAGGSTPIALYQQLAEGTARQRLDWSRVRFLWGDERCVPPERPESNYRQALESLLEPLAIAPDSVYRVPAELGPAAAAAAYEETLRGLLAGDRPRLDLVLLGMGRDGHTASLFPGAEEPADGVRWVIPARAPQPPRDRVSLAPLVLNGARKVVFLVRGSAKAAMVARVLGGGGSAARLPAARVRPSEGELVWFLDRESAARLPSNVSAGG